MVQIEGIGTLHMYMYMYVYTQCTCTSCTYTCILCMYMQVLIHVSTCRNYMYIHVHVHVCTPIVFRRCTIYALVGVNSRSILLRPYPITNVDTVVPINA